MNIYESAKWLEDNGAGDVYICGGSDHIYVSAVLMDTKIRISFETDEFKYLDITAEYGIVSKRESILISELENRLEFIKGESLKRLGTYDQSVFKLVNWIGNFKKIEPSLYTIFPDLRIEFTHKGNGWEISLAKSSIDQSWISKSGEIVLTGTFPYCYSSFMFAIEEGLKGI